MLLQSFPAKNGITPSGTINITENGDINVTNYATAHVVVSGGLPNNMEIVDIAIETDSSSIDIPYDNTKTVFMVYAYDLNYAESQTSTITMVTLKKQTNGNNYITSASMIAGSAGSIDGATSMTPTFDAENGIINCACRTDRYFRSGRTFRAIIIYVET